MNCVCKGYFCSNPGDRVPDCRLEDGSIHPAVAKMMASPGWQDRVPMWQVRQAERERREREQVQQRTRRGSMYLAASGCVTAAFLASPLLKLRWEVYHGLAIAVGAVTTMLFLRGLYLYDTREKLEWLWGCGGCCWGYVAWWIIGATIQLSLLMIVLALLGDPVLEQFLPPR